MNKKINSNLRNIIDRGQQTILGEFRDEQIQDFLNHDFLDELGIFLGAKQDDPIYQSKRDDIKHRIKCCLIRYIEKAYFLGVDDGRIIERFKNNG